MKISTQNPSPLTRSTVFVGLDVHKNSIVLAARIARQQDWLAERTFCTKDLSKLKKFLKKLSKHGTLSCCYEASGAGFYLYRLLRSWDVHCEVIASSLQVEDATASVIPQNLETVARMTDWMLRICASISPTAC